MFAQAWGGFAWQQHPKLGVPVPAVGRTVAFGGGGERLGFSCKRRGLCPPCGARRLSQMATHLVDPAVPDVPVRQWVLSLPIPLRVLLAAQHELVAPVLQVVQRVMPRPLRDGAGLGAGEDQGGAVALWPALRLGRPLEHPLHGVVPDGAYCCGADGAPASIQADAPTDDGAHALLQTVIARTMLRGAMPRQPCLPEPPAYGSAQARGARGPLGKFSGDFGAVALQTPGPLHPTPSIGAALRARQESHTMPCLKTTMTTTRSPIRIRTLLALAAGATLAAAAQAAPVYFTFQGLTIAPPVAGLRGYDGGSDADTQRNVGVNAGASTGAGSLGNVMNAAGSPFSFTLGFDNGGSSALNQTWTAADVRLMRIELPTSSGVDYYLNLLFGGANGIGLNRLNRASGSFTTDANGQASSVFSAIGSDPNRSIKAFTPTADQAQTNSTDPITLLRGFGLMDTSAYVGGSGLSFCMETASTHVTEVELRGYNTCVGWGSGTGLANAANWHASTATGERLASDGPAANGVPEPASWALSLLGVAAALGFSRPRRRAASL